MASLPLIAVLSRTKRFSFPRKGVRGFERLCYLMNWYERDTVAVCRDQLRPGMNAVDIGAHLGYFSRLFGKLTGPGGKVFAFEPHPETFSVLRRNLSQLPNVIPVHKAVSDTTGHAELFEMTASGQHSLVLNVRPETQAFLKSRIPVESTTLDDFLAGQGDPPIRLVKIDVDGGETKVLRGMVQTIAKNAHLTLVVEFAPVSLAASGTTPEQFLELLQSLGFQVEGLGFSLAGLQIPSSATFAPNLLCTKTP
jgi:FkbM family methyltransferase